MLEEEDFEIPESEYCDHCGMLYCDGSCMILSDEPENLFVDYDYYTEEEIEIMAIPIELPEDMQRDIVERCAAGLVAKLEPTAKKLIEEKVNEAWEHALGQKADALCSQLVDEFATKPRKKTNSYGEPTGQEITFSEIILDSWTKYASELVDNDGRAGSYGKIPRLEWMIRKAGVDPINEVAKQEIAKISEKARTQIQEAVSAFIAQQLTPKVHALEGK